MLDVRAAEPYLLVRNSSTLLMAAQSDGDASGAVLSRDNVAVQTNIDYENDSDVQFTVVRAPVHGVVDVVDDDGRTRPSCRRFTLADVRRGSVVYRRDADVDRGVDSDQFVVVVRLEDLQTSASVDVNLTARPPTTTTRLPLDGTLEVGGSLAVSVDQLADVVIGADQLSASVTSFPVDADDIRYEQAFLRLIV